MARETVTIEGLDDAERLDEVRVFHAGTGRGASGGVVATGGRVLGVTATGRDLRAVDRSCRAEGAEPQPVDGLEAVVFEK